jgi:hypothetical protein
MHADAAFIVGHAHHEKAQPCQDYALAGPEDAVSWAIVSDGCSSGGHTDLGARIWTQAAAKLLRTRQPADLGSAEAFAQDLQSELRTSGLTATLADLLATLVMASADARTVRVVAYGDGCVLLRHADGRVHVIELTYEQNAPRYLAYVLDARLTEKWVADTAGTKRTARHWYFDAAGHLESFRDEEQEAAEGLAWDFSFDRTTEDLDLVVVATDGATSIESKAPSEWFLPLTAIRSCKGQFLQRRLSALVRGWQKQGVRGPTDDLAVAGIWLKEDLNNV